MQLKRSVRSKIRQLAGLLLLVTVSSGAFAKPKKKAPAPTANTTRQAAEADTMASEAGDAFSDDATPAGTYRIRTLLQTRFTHTAVDLGPIQDKLRQGPSGIDVTNLYRDQILEQARSGDGTDINRAFLRLAAQPTRQFGMKVLADFAEFLHKNQKGALKLAYGEMRVNRSLTLTAGLFKIPFSLLELLPIADYEFADVGVTDALIKDLGVGGRDIGLMAAVTPLQKKRYLQLSIGAYDGDNHNHQRYTGPGIFAARARTRAIPHLELGADCAYRPHAVRDLDASGTPYEKHAQGGACSADATFGYKRFAFRGEFMKGKRTDSPLFTDHITHQFSALWGLATYRIRLSRSLVLLPAGRDEWLDEDQATGVGQTTLVSAAMNLNFGRSTRLLMDLSRANVQVGTKDRNGGTAASQRYRPSTTTGVVQLQFLL
jgi:hypothetical protein